MGQISTSSRIAAPALAIALSALLAMSAPLDAARAFAVESATENPSGGGASRPIAEVVEPSEDASEPDASQHVEIVKLPAAVGSQETSDTEAGDAVQSSGPAAESPSPSHSDSSPQASGEVPLSKETPKPTIGEVVADGFVYRVLPDGASVALVGWRGVAPTGEVSVPAQVSCGEDLYAVTRVGALGADGKSAGVLVDSSTTSISVPASVGDIVDGALSNCPTLERVEVSSKNETYSSFDGALYSKDLTSLLFFPEGRQGAARIPDRTATVPALALSHSPGLQAVLVGEASASFSSWNGILYTKDLLTLVECPPGAAGAVVVPEEVETIATGAFAGCEVTSVAALGNVREIAADAFDESSKFAVVALPAGDDYDTRKAVWEAAGFSTFAEPAGPGATVEPSESGDDGEVEPSGLAYTLLDDYTLSVAWTGPDDPVANLEIPATAKLNGVSYRVSAVAPNAFEGRASLRSVKLPVSVTSIGEAAFANCSNLASVDLPEGLREIGASAFEATALTDLWLPVSLQSVGSRVLAACASLGRVVAPGAPEVAADVLAECSGVTVYCPSASAASWNMGLPAAGNHLAPYGVTLSETPLAIEVGQSASLFDNGSLEAPGGVQTSFAYSAKPVSVDQNGLATAKDEGTSEVTVTLILDNKELVRATRTVEVESAPESLDQRESETSQVQLPNGEQLYTTSATQLRQTFSFTGADPSVGDLQPVSETALLATGKSFERQIASGQVLKFTVLTEDVQAKVGTVSAAKSDDTSSAPAGALVVPSSVEDGGIVYDVVAVADSGFSQCNGLMSISFEGDALTMIGRRAFDGCRGLRIVSLPHAVTSLGARAFANCGSLTMMNIPDSVKSFGEYLFLDAVSLVEVSLGSGYRTVSTGDFSGCSRLRAINVSGEVSSFDPTSFNYVSTEAIAVRVPNEQARVAWIDSSMASGIGFAPELVTVQGETCTVIYDAKGGTPSSYTQVVPQGGLLESSVEPWRNGYGFLGWFKDEACTQAWDASEPVVRDAMLYAKWVEEVRDGGFVYRMRQDGASLSVAAESPSDLGGEIRVPESFTVGGTTYPVAEVAVEAFSGATRITSVELGDSIEIIGPAAFQGCTSLAVVPLGAGSSLKQIGFDSFSGCTALEKMSFPATVDAIEPGAFYGCSKLKAVDLSACADLKVIKSAVFSGCSSLVSVTLPDILETLEKQVFYGCSSLGAISLPSSLKTIGTNAFFECADLAGDITLPSGVQNILERTFYGCSSLRSVDMPSVRTIGKEAFAGCATLTSIKLPTSLTAVAQNAFLGCAALDVVSAASSLRSVDLSAAFTQASKANATVVLPSVSQDGTESFAAMVDVWKNVHGFANVVAGYGDLPTDGNTMDGRWELASDGTLHIWCERAGAVIQDLGWSETAYADGHWAPVRAAVKSIAFADSVDALNMAWWFAGMVGLDFAPDITFPPSVTSVRGLFSGCSSMTGLPNGFVLPDSIRVCSHLFKDCTSLTSLPASFAVPSGIDDVDFGLCGMFWNCASLETLPDGFVIPDTPGLTKMDGVFKGCTSLSMLPAGFSIPDRVEKCSGTFQDCSSLVSLPEGFRIPSSCKVLTYTFSGCSSLSSLPEGLTVPSGANPAYAFSHCSSLASLPDRFDIPASAVADSTVFQVVGDSRPMFYAGMSENVKNYPWDQANRTLVTPASKPSGAKTVQLNVKVEGEAGTGSFWTTVHTDASGMLAEPAFAPSRAGYVFALWYVDAACTQRADFSQPFGSDVTLYGKFAPGTRGGALPTEAGTGAAFWSLADDGTLYIRGGGTVETLNWEENSAVSYETHWGPYRSLVKKVAMDPSIKVKYMIYWFADMVNLVDVSQVELSESTNFRRAFKACTALETLPENMVLPVGTTNASCMFQQCENLRSLPAGFTIPEGTQYIQYLFWECPSLSSLPEGFTVPSSVQDASRMLAGCTSLTNLPDGFAVPSEVLARSNEPFLCDLQADGSRVTTYYAGNDKAVLAYDWESQNRTLVATGSDMEGYGMQRATFKVQSATPDANGVHQWETRSTSWSDKQGILANPGDLQLDGYTFTGWCTDEECLVPFDFSKPLPEGGVTLYGTWVVAGAKNAVERAGGELPCVDVAGNSVASTAWWRITSDGTFSIKGDGTIGDLKLSWNVETTSRDYWEHYRDRVWRIRMDEGLGAVTMRAWFCRMHNLVDASGIFVPDGCVNVNDMLYDCPSLTMLPTDFRLPESVDSAESFLQSCPLITELPDSFLLPSNMWRASGMFRYCSNLASLPEGFTIPIKTQLTSSMFEGCHSLVSLPEGFSVPDSVVNMDLMFWGCNALTSLPASFDFPLAAAETAENPFLSTNGVIETYFAGGVESPSSVNAYSKWASQSRSITASVPAGKVLVALMVPDKETGSYKLSTRLMVEAEATMAEPRASVRKGFTFMGWFTDDTLTTRYDFAAEAVPAAGLTLYAYYAANSGTLPTTDGERNATWELTADGTLKIACAQGATIKDLGWTSDKASSAYFTNGYWGHARSQVKKVVMEPGVRAQSMAHWFGSMVNLVDIANVYIPSGVTSLHGTFASCSQLKTLPEGFSIPEGVTDMVNCFLNCSGIVELPANLSFPDTVTEMNGCFARCSFTALPEGFRLPDGLKRGQDMFLSSKLTSLPVSFALPDAIENANHMFYGTSLSALPAGFRIPTGFAGATYEGTFENTPLGALPVGFIVPANVASVEAMFRSTPLTTLPEGFAIEGSSTRVAHMFENCPELISIPASLKLVELRDAGTPLTNMFGWWPSLPGYISEPVTTYYAGSLDDVLGADYWKADYNRTLASLEAGRPASTYVVTYRLQKPGASSMELWMTQVAAPKEGSSNAFATKPTDPIEFGYMFSGWKDAATGQVFDFSQPMTGDVTLNGSYTLMLDVDIPMAAKVSVDASGNVEAGGFDVVSNTPRKLVFTQVTSTTAPGASKLLPNAAEHKNVKLDMRLGDRNVSLPIAGGSSDYVAVLLAATPGTPSTLAGSIGLDLAGAQIDFQPGEDITSLAKLTWTVEAMS